jgi:hypothetical protein
MNQDHLLFITMNQDRVVKIHDFVSEILEFNLL